MKSRNRFPKRTSLALALTLLQGTALNALAHGTGPGGIPPGHAHEPPPRCQLFTADRVFDGFKLHQKAAVLIERAKVAQVGSPQQLKQRCDNRTNLGNATILPGFIESHAHLTFQNVPSDTVLEHGITTVRDVGGPLRQPTGGNGTLRLLSAGPIIQARNPNTKVLGYPLNVFGGGNGGYGQVGIVVNDDENDDTDDATAAQQARAIVRHLVQQGGAPIIKIALESGGEAGAPWMMDHGHGEPPATPWPLLSLKTVQAIVDEAHKLGKRVSAHVGENEGAQRALEGRVDEWAHVPCAEIDEGLLQQAVNQGVKVVTTIDTLSSCAGIHANTHTLAHMMAHAGNRKAEFLYGSEIGHDNVPWGINGEEMHLMLHLTSGDKVDFTDVVNVFKAATSQAGKNLGRPLLGTLKSGAPADLIAVRGNPFERFKLLEYPHLVISGGHIIVDEFK